MRELKYAPGPQAAEWFTMTAPVFHAPFPLPLVPTGEKAGGLPPFTNAPMHFRHSACHNVDNFVRFCCCRSSGLWFINALRMSCDRWTACEKGAEIVVTLSKTERQFVKVVGLEIENIRKVLSRLAYKHSCASQKHGWKSTGSDILFLLWEKEKKNKYAPLRESFAHHLRLSLCWLNFSTRVRK